MQKLPVLFLALGALNAHASTDASDTFCLGGGNYNAPLKRGVDCVSGSNQFVEWLPNGPAAMLWWSTEDARALEIRELRERGYELISVVQFGGKYDVYRKQDPARAPRKQEICLEPTYSGPEQIAFGCTAGVMISVDATWKTPTKETLAKNGFVFKGLSRFIGSYRVNVYLRER